MDIRKANQAAWDQAVDQGDNPYTWTVSTETIAAARAGRWEILLSDCRPAPRAWFPSLAGVRVLCLASGGGQQAPILAAAGAVVTSVDASPRQVDLDRYVAERDGLELDALVGDMADLSAWSDGTFELIVNPPSTLFVPDLEPVWRECHRVLAPGGVLMTGFMNPDEFVFDADALDHDGAFVVRHPLPFVEHETLTEDVLAARLRQQEMFHFSHSMESQLGGLLAAGFVITGFYEDRRTEADGNPIRHYLPSFYVVRATKPA